VHHVRFGVLGELLLVPQVILGAQRAVVPVETVDEHLAVLVAVIGARIPEVDVTVHHKILLAIFLVQKISFPTNYTVTALRPAAPLPPYTEFFPLRYTCPNI
jgi:hypothetical protein